MQLTKKTWGSIEGFDYSARPYLKTDPSRYVGLWVGYRGYGLGYTVNVGGDKGAYLTLGAMGGAYGQFNNMRYRHDSSHGHLNDWFVNTSLGIRL